MDKIGPTGGSTARWLRILANQLDANEAPDFFIVTSLGDCRMEASWRTLDSPVELLGCIEVKASELKAEIVGSKISLTP